MQVMKLSQVPKSPFYGPTPTIGVGTITAQLLVTDKNSKNYIIKMVNFGKGARNKFHKHTCDQVLIVTAGKGVVVTDQGRTIVEPGDIVLVSAGEKHWHGSNGDSEFSHFFVLAADNVTTQLEE